MIFNDRHHAGELLAKELASVIGENHSEALVLALPRGGVPVGAVVAEKLFLPMNVLVVRKIGAPFNREYAIGALCESCEPILNDRYLNASALRDYELSQLIDEERKKIVAQVKKFRRGEKLSRLSDRTIVLVDDGLATGATVAAAVKFLKTKNVGRIIVAAPIISESAYLRISPRVQKVVFVEKSDELMSVGEWYEDFSQVSDEEVEDLLKQFRSSEKKESVMATEQKPTKNQSQRVSQVLDTAGGEMPNPKAPPHGPSEEELAEVLKKSTSETDRVPDSEGDLEDQAEREIENDIRGGIDRAREDLRH